VGDNEPPVRGERVEIEDVSKVRARSREPMKEEKRRTMPALLDVELVARNRNRAFDRVHADLLVVRRAYRRTNAVGISRVFV